MPDILKSMKKDLLIPEVKNVFIAAMETVESDGAKNWWIYLINATSGPLENIIVNSRGYSDLDSKGGIQTASMRKSIKVLPAQTAAKLEPIMPEVFELFNEYWVSFFENGEMKDRKYIFGPYTIDANFCESLPILQKQGVLIR